MSILTTNPNFTNGTGVDADTMNDIAETAINANSVATKLASAPDNTEASSVGTPSVSIGTNGNLVFKNLKGETGAQGVSVSKIEKTGTSGLVDTYTITLSNGNTSTFTVSNGADGNPPTISVSEYTAGKTYYSNSTRLDLVTYGGSTYSPKNSSVSNILPTDATYWNLIAAKGTNVGGNVATTNNNSVQTGSYIYGFTPVSIPSEASGAITGVWTLINVPDVSAYLKVSPDGATANSVLCTNENGSLLNYFLLSSLVQTSGDQTINGIKSFTSPIRFGTESMNYDLYNEFGCYSGVTAMVNKNNYFGFAYAKSSGVTNRVIFRLSDTQDDNSQIFFTLPSLNGTIALTSDIASERSTANSEYVKNMLHLGYYDTYTIDSNGNYVVTRQTGYGKSLISSLGSWYSEGSLYGHRMSINTADFSSTKMLVDKFKVFEDADDAFNYNPSGNEAIFNPMSSKLSIYYYNSITWDSILTTEINYQYQLSTSYTETYEPNHFARIEPYVQEYAKSEADRSSNLFNTGITFNETLNNVSVAFDGRFLSLNGTASAGKSTYIGSSSLVLKAGTYTMKQVLISGTASSEKWAIMFADGNGNTIVPYSHNDYTFTLSSDTTLGIIIWWNDTYTFTNARMTLMLVSGSHALPYQPYEGKALHESFLTEGTITSTATAKQPTGISIAVTLTASVEAVIPVNSIVTGISITASAGTLSTSTLPISARYAADGTQSKVVSGSVSTNDASFTNSSTATITLTVKYLIINR